MAPMSTVLTQSAVSEGDEIFTEILSHIKIIYPEVYGPAASLVWAPERREFMLGEGVGFSGGTSSATSISKVGAYAGKFKNLSPRLSEITNVYLDTPIVVPTPEHL